MVDWGPGLEDSTSRRRRRAAEEGLGLRLEWSKNREGAPGAQGCLCDTIPG